MKNKHTIEEFMCWRRENLVNLVNALCLQLNMSLFSEKMSHKTLAKEAKQLCDELDALETPITIVAESGGRDVDTKELT
jgi:hypothetical protein